MYMLYGICIYLYNFFMSNTLIASAFLCRKTSAAIYGATAFVTFVWLTDWKVVCRHIPFYGSKYERSRTYANEPAR